MKIGIDPGASGAIAWIYDSGSVEMRDMPVAHKSSGKGNEVVPRLVADMLFANYDEVMVYLEAVHAMPGQGVTSMFSFGRSMGVVEGVLAALEIPYTLVRPRAWKKRAGLIGKPKDASRGLAMRLYPQAAEYLTRKKDNGRAEALLIAHFGEG